MKAALITGSTGLVGSLVLGEWIRNRSFDRICCLVREVKPAGTDGSIIYVKGDLTLDHFGLPPSVYQMLVRQTTALFHSAADTSFTVSREAAQAVNIRGTQRVTSFARACGALEKFGYISTAYVAGKRQGMIGEDELVRPEGFVNTYEESKYAAEEHVEKMKKTLPINVYRLSTVIGSTTGTVRQFNAVHQALRICYHGLAPFIPASPESRVDFVSEEYVSGALYSLFMKNFIPGKTYHIVAGPDASMPILDLLDNAFAVFEAYDTDWKRRSVERPALADEQTFRTFVDTVNQLHNPVLSDIIGSMNTFAPQLLYPKTFGQTNSRKQLSPLAIQPTPVGHYFRKVVEYCLATNWGKSRKQ
jgi:nucleoside-diphosphate-sugar epimerase